MRVDENNIAYKDFFVRAKDTDMFYNATVPFYFSTIQEMGGEHAAEMGISIADLMAEKSWTWVITRARVVFHKDAIWRDTISLETWPEEPFGLHVPRVVNGFDKNGNPLFEAMTIWALLDIARKRPVRPKEIIDRVRIPKDEGHLVNPDIGKVKSFADCNKLQTYPMYRPIPVYYDLDYNRHVNNTIYLDWIMAAMDQEVLMNYSPSVIDVQWKKQTFFNDKVYVETAMTEKTDDSVAFSHRIMKEEGEGKEDSVVFEASSEWKRKEKLPQ